LFAIQAPLLGPKKAFRPHHIVMNFYWLLQAVLEIAATMRWYR